MNETCYAFNKAIISQLPPRRLVVELGSLDVNGSVRDVLPADSRYIGVDIRAGRGVDVVADAAEYVPPEAPDLVICNSMLEHTPRAAEIVANAYKMLADGGVLVLCCPTPEWPTHCWDGGSLMPGEHYHAPTESELRAMLRPFSQLQLSVYDKQYMVMASKGRLQRKLKLLLVNSGASWSTADVNNGYRKYLERLGVNVIPYTLDGRISAAGGWLNYCWKRAGKPEPKPTSGDILYTAGIQIVERALRHQVDWVVIVSAMYLHPDVLALLQRAGIKTAVMFTESPYDDDNQVRFAELVNVCFTNERSSLERFRLFCPEVHYLAHAYDPEVHQPQFVGEEVPGHDVVFVGTGFLERVELLSAVDWTGIDLGVYGHWALLGNRARLRKALRGGVVDNRITALMYQRAKIGLNLHRTSIGFDRQATHIQHAESVNPRILELAACGAFWLSDWRAELGEMFGSAADRNGGPGSVVFANAEDLQAQVRHYLAEPGERERLANTCKEAVQGQTFEARAQQVIGVLARCA